MRCKYIFDVSGRVKPQTLSAFEIDGMIFEFVLDEESGFIKKISVSIQIDKTDYPRINPSPDCKSEHSLKVSSPRLDEINEVLRQIEGMFSFWGLNYIEIDSPTYQWLPENKDEEKQLSVFSYSKKVEGIPDNEVQAIPFELIAKPIIGAVKDKKHDVLFSLYRRGRKDLVNRENIAAIYNFYFILESYYADGKYSKNAVMSKLINSRDFVEKLNNVLRDNFFQQSLPERLRDTFQTRYLNKPIDELIELIVDMRGFLHHFSSKRKKNWHPDQQDDYRLDAIFLSKLTHDLILSIMNKNLSSSEVSALYEELITKLRNGEPPTLKLKTR